VGAACLCEQEWIPDSVWLNIVALSSLEAFRDIPDSVFRNDGLWRQWYDQEAPEMAKVRVGVHGGGVWQALPSRLGRYENQQVGRYMNC
jgi:hypothetical protein